MNNDIFDMRISLQQSQAMIQEMKFLNLQQILMFLKLKVNDKIMQ